MSLGKTLVMSFIIPFSDALQGENTLSPQGKLVTLTT